MKKIVIFAAFFSLFFINSVSAAEFSANLKYGSKGNDVIKLQEFLNEQGLYNGPITGNFFSLTLKAVKALQTREAISPVSGFFGNLTRAKVNDILDSQLVESVSESVNEPVVSEPAPVSAEVLRLNEILGVVQNQNKLLQDSLALQQAEAQRLRAIADAAEVKAQAELQVRQAQEAANAAAMARSEQQAAIEASKPLYTPEQLMTRYLYSLYEGGPNKKLLNVSRSRPTPIWSDGSTYPERTSGETRTAIGFTTNITFSINNELEKWGDAKVIFNGKTVLDKNGSYCGADCINLDAMQQYRYQLVLPSPGREDSVYEGTI